MKAYNSLITEFYLFICVYIIILYHISNYITPIFILDHCFILFFNIYIYIFYMFLIIWE